MPLPEPLWRPNHTKWKLIDQSPAVYQVAIYESKDWVERPPSGMTLEYKRYCVWEWTRSQPVYQSNFLPACRVWMAGYIAGVESWEKQLLVGEVNE